MRKALLLSAIPLLLAPAIAWSQAESALNATRVKDFILVSPSGTSIQFGVDVAAKSALLATLTPNQVFSVSGRRGLNLMLAFQNPLKVTWTLSSKDGPDPLVASVEKFLTSASAIATGLVVPTATGGQETERASTPDVTWSPKTSFAPSRVPALESQPFIDPALLAWGLALGDEGLAVCRASANVVLTPATTNAVVLDRLVNWDRRTKGDSISSAADFRGVLTGSLGALLAASDMNALREAAGKMGAQLGLLDGSNSSARTYMSLLAEDSKRFSDIATQLAVTPAAGSNQPGDASPTSLRSVVSRVADVAPSSNTSTACPIALRYSRAAITSFLVRASRVIDAREAVVSELRAVATEINARLAKALPEDEGFKIGRVEITGKRTTVTLTFQERIVSIRGDQVVVENGKSQGVTFEVMEHQSVVPEFVPGLAYSQVSFRRYKTNDSSGVHVVADGGDYQPHTIPMGMLNLMPNTGWSGFTRLVGQVGVGVTKESIVVLTGAGIRFSQPMRFVLSVGALFPFEQELTDLKLGSVVAGEAALQKDLQRTLGKPSLYIAIQK